MTQTAASLRRDKAITRIVDHYIGQYGYETGQLVSPVDFPALSESVDNLRSMGRSQYWQTGIAKWQACIQYAAKEFCDQNEFTHDITSIGNETDYTVQTGRELIRLFKWAVQQGGHYAYMYNR